ncbi:flagellar hook-basal body complex protein FliE [Burkholderia ubonensis]|nr:flagellar hook-basal body complex protein FliE [Burkholderia ubonensis]
MITPIAGIGAVANTTAASTGVDPVKGFESSILGMIHDVDSSLKSADAAVASFAVGGAVPPHRVMLALEQARLKLQFAMQVRTQVLEGFQELMRTQL